jgi:hypothetical protein
MSCDDDLIGQLFNATAEVIYDTDMQHGDGRNYWPFHPVLLDSLVAPIVFQELLRLFRKLRKRKYSLADVAETLQSPTKVANYQYLWPVSTIRGLRTDAKLELATIFLKLLIILRNGEPFCEKGRNLLWSRSVVDRKVAHISEGFVNAGEQSEMAALLAKVEGLLVSYAESLYYYMIDLSRMMHGPYALVDGSCVFVKEYLHLRAAEMCPLAAGFPFDHFQEIGVYRNLDARVYFMGHVHAKPSFPRAIERFCVILDGKVISDAGELRNVYQGMSAVVDKVVAELAEHADDERFLLRRGIDMFFYPLRRLYQAAGEEWREVLLPAYDFAARMRRRVRVPGPWGDWSRQKAVRHLMKLMDFRRKARR